MESTVLLLFIRRSKSVRNVVQSEIIVAALCIGASYLRIGEIV